MISSDFRRKSKVDKGGIGDKVGVVAYSFDNMPKIFDNMGEGYHPMAHYVQ